MSRPPFATILTDIVNNVQSDEIAALNSFFEGPGMYGVFSFLAGKARQGQTNAYLHFDATWNPLSVSAGFAAPGSGELQLINAPPTPGVIERNSVGWVFLGSESRYNDTVSVLTIPQFQEVVLTFINNLITNELLTVTYVTGATMFDVFVSWDE